MAIDKEDCLTVGDLLEALSSGAVDMDMPIGHLVLPSHWMIQKIVGVKVYSGGIVVFESESDVKALNDEEDEAEPLHDLL